MALQAYKLRILAVSLQINAKNQTFDAKLPIQALYTQYMYAIIAQFSPNLLKSNKKPDKLVLTAIKKPQNTWKIALKSKKLTLKAVN